MTRRKTATSHLLTVLSGGLALTLGVGFAATACNSVSGADKISLYSSNDDDDSGAGAGNSSTGGSGMGGNTGTESNGAGAGNSSSGTTNPDGSGPNASANNSSSSSGMGPCVYPPGPYGVDQGQTVPPSLSWQVYAPGSNAVTTLKMEDLHDCDGTGNIDVIIVDTSQYG